MRAWPSLLFLAAVVLGFPPVSAQTEGPALDLAPPSTADGGPVALDPDSTALLAGWTYRFPTAASAAATFGGQDVVLTWSLSCAPEGLRLVGDATTIIPFVPGQTEYAGVATLAATASQEAPGVVPLACILVAHASAATPVLEVEGQAAFSPSVTFRGQIHAEVATASKQAGPQKQIPYGLEITNTGNARTQVTFELVERPDRSKWNALLPEVVLLDPGQSLMAVFTVATPFNQGYNNDDGRYLIRLQPAAAEDPEQVGPTVDVEVHAKVNGWYIPGLSPLALVGILGVAALALRRRWT
jgi:hypothetical protein